MNYLVARAEMEVRRGYSWSGYTPQIDFFDLPDLVYLDQIEKESRESDRYRIDVVKRLIEAQQISKNTSLTPKTSHSRHNVNII